MINSVDSYVKIWVWESNEEKPQAAPAYGCVALETFHQERSKYISFCLDSRCKLKPATSNGYPAHFHQKIEDDDAIQTGKTARAYRLFFLDVSKINSAFKQFKKNPNARGSLGWGIFDRAYSFNACGLTAFLLDKGKIFSDPIYQDIIALNSLTQRIISGLGLFYSGMNCWVGYQCSSFSEQIKDSNHKIMRCAAFFKGAIHGAFVESDIIKGRILFNELQVHEMNQVVAQFNALGQTRKENWMSAEEIKQFNQKLEGSNQLLKFMTKYLENLKNIGKILDCAKIADTKFDTYPWQDKYESVKTFTDSAGSISKRLFGIAAITMVALGAFQYVNNRIKGRYDARDIVLLAEKAVYAERLHGMKIKQVAFTDLLPK